MIPLIQEALRELFFESFVATQKQKPCLECLWKFQLGLNKHVIIRSWVYINSSLWNIFIDVNLYIRLWCTTLSRVTLRSGCKMRLMTFKKSSYCTGNERSGIED